MKNITLLLLLFSFSASAQLYDKFPFNDSGEIVYSSTIEVEGKLKEELYTSSKVFFANSFVSANDVIQMDDKDAGIIIGKGSENFRVLNGKTAVPVTLHFTLRIDIKGNRYSYAIYNLNFENAGGKFSASDLFSKKKEIEYNAAKKSAQEIVNKYRDMTISTTDKLIEDLKKEMEK